MHGTISPLIQDPWIVLPCQGIGRCMLNLKIKILPETVFIMSEQSKKLRLQLMEHALSE
jgi:hypothetical protein